MPASAEHPQPEKAALRAKLTRYLELAAGLAHQAEQRKDRAELQQLEGRLQTALGELQAQIRHLQELLATYDTLPLWQRLSMQVFGSNLSTLQERCALYEAQQQGYLRELTVAQARLAELTAEDSMTAAAQQEYEALRAELERLGDVEEVRRYLGQG